MFKHITMVIIFSVRFMTIHNHVKCLHFFDRDDGKKKEI